MSTKWDERQERLDEFLDRLHSVPPGEDIDDFGRRHFLHGTPYVFEDREDDFYKFRARIAKNFNISFSEILITGSGKLGFSPHKRKIFDLDSDIDISIVSPRLFDYFMNTIHHFQMELRASRTSVRQSELDMYHEFLEYAAIGWMRPDKLPLSFRVKSLKDEWFTFFESISNGRSEVGNYEVNAGLFKSHWHLESYVLSGLRELKTNLAMERRRG